MPFSTSYANDILNYTFAKTQSLSAPTAVYIGLCTNDPEADGGAFMELSGNAYARVLISQKGESYPALIGSASSRAISNIAQINWNKASNDWQRVKGFGLFSSASGGSPFFYGKLELTPEEEAAGGILCEAGAVMLFDPNTLKISFPTTDVDE
jgi:hypothetical protein